MTGRDGGGRKGRRRGWGGGPVVPSVANTIDDFTDSKRGEIEFWSGLMDDFGDKGE
jgi:hypothetical protein